MSNRSSLDVNPRSNRPYVIQHSEVPRSGSHTAVMGAPHSCAGRSASALRERASTSIMRFSAGTPATTMERSWCEHEQSPTRSAPTRDPNKRKPISTESATHPFVILPVPTCRGSEAEGSAVRHSALPNPSLQTSTPKQMCHPACPGLPWKRSRGTCCAPLGLPEFFVSRPQPRRRL
jgi:hypothetical protein